MQLIEKFKSIFHVMANHNFLTPLTSIQLFFSHINQNHKTIVHLILNNKIANYRNYLKENIVKFYKYYSSKYVTISSVHCSNMNISTITEIFKFSKLFHKTAILKYAAPQWFYWCTFGYSSILILLFAALPSNVVNFGQWLDFIYGEHASISERILRGYLTIQISIGTVRFHLFILNNILCNNGKNSR